MSKTTMAETIQTSRDAAYQLYAEGYCGSASNCAMREVVMHFKDHDGTLVAAVRRQGLRCPVCGAQLTLHWVRTADEHQAVEEQEARISVNMQRRRRDVPDGQLVVETWSDLLDDSLDG